VNRRKKPRRKKKEPPFLRKMFAGQGVSAPAKVLTILAWAIAVWFGFAILVGDTGVVSILQMRRMKAGLVNEIAALEAVKAETIELRDNLKNDPWTIEKVARERYGMIRDGEICYRVILPNEDGVTDSH
jgi:cell division protein FtsB